jgi:protein-arginine kinase
MKDYPSTTHFRTVMQILAIKKSHPDNRACKHFDVDYFMGLDDVDQGRLLQVINSGICNPDSGMGCYAMAFDDYDKFKPFFAKVLADYHDVREDAKHVNDWSLAGVAGLPESGVLDLRKLGLPKLSMRVRVGRNLKRFPLPGNMTKDDRINLERQMCGAFDVLRATFGGGYNSLTPGHEHFVSEAKYAKLVDAHIMFKDMSVDPFLASAGIASHWPFGRGCYVSADSSFIVWVGEEDHLRIMCMTNGTVLNEVFDRLNGALEIIDRIDGLKFAKSDDYGYVTSCPTNLGTGMRASIHIQLPKLTKDGQDDPHGNSMVAKAIARPLGLSVRGLGGEHTPIGADGTVDISPSSRFCITEAEIITALYRGIKQMKEAEDAM